MPETPAKHGETLANTELANHVVFTLTGNRWLNANMTLIRTTRIRCKTWCRASSGSSRVDSPKEKSLAEGHRQNPIDVLFDDYSALNLQNVCLNRRRPAVTDRTGGKTLAFRRMKMDRRRMLTSAGAVAVAGMVSGAAQAQEKSSIKSSSNLDKMHQDCLDACQSCEVTCNETVKYCMTHLSEGHKDHAACAELALSCQDFCGLSVKVIARSSTLAADACAACAEACDACATECEKMKANEQMSLCAKACRKCAVACRQMG